MFTVELQKEDLPTGLRHLLLALSDRRYLALSAPSHPSAVPPFSKEELQALRDGGFEEASFAPGEGPLEASRRAVEKLQAESWTVADAAAFLHEDESRLLERIQSRTLYAFQLGGSWRVPTFQLTDHDVVPGMAEVAPELAPELPPLVVERWFTTPTDELTLEDERPMSPLEWLRRGLPPERVAELAQYVGTGT